MLPVVSSKLPCPAEAIRQAPYPCTQPDSQASTSICRVSCSSIKLTAASPAKCLALALQLCMSLLKEQANVAAVPDSHIQLS